MTTATSSVSDLLVTTKSREVQRGIAAEMRGDRRVAARHFLAAAHLELVLCDDYTDAGLGDLARRSRLGAASCFWRAGSIDQAKELLSEMAAVDDESAKAAAQVRADLESNYPMAS